MDTNGPQSHFWFSLLRRADYSNYLLHLVTEHISCCKLYTWQCRQDRLQQQRNLTAAHLLVSIVVLFYIALLLQ